MWKENVHQLPAFQIFLCSQHSCEILSFTEEMFTDVYAEYHLGPGNNKLPYGALSLVKKCGKLQRNFSSFTSATKK